MSVLKANDWVQNELTEVQPDGYLRALEIRRLVELTHLALGDKVNLLAYSNHTEPQPAEADWMYHWTCRIRSSENTIRFVVWADSSPWELFHIHPTTGARTSVGSSSSGLGTPGVITFSVAALPTDSMRKYRFQLASAGGLGANEFHGFHMTEIKASVGAADFDLSGGALEPIDSWPYQAGKSYHEAFVKRLLENVEKVLSERVRGCAHVYPREFLPTIGSVYWRAFGPIRMDISPWCSSATVILELHNPTPVGDLYMIMRSSERKEQFSKVSALNEAQVIGTGANADPRMTDAYTFEGVGVSPGKPNNFFPVYTSEADEDFTSPPFAKFQWKKPSMGIAEVYHVEPIDSDRWWYDIINTPDTSCPFGYHVYVVLNTNVDSDPADPKHTVEFFNYTDLGGTNSYGTNDGAYVPYDYALFISANDSGTKRKIRMSLSPSPDFLGFTESQGFDRGEETYNSSALATLGKHAYTRVLSVWINEEFDAGPGGLGQDSVLARTLPSSSRVQNAATLMNKLISSCMPCYGMSIQAAQSTPEQIHNFTGWDPVLNGQFKKDCNWQVYRTFNELFEFPVDAFSNDLRHWRRVAQFPYLSVRDSSDDRKVPIGIRVTMDYLSVVTGAKEAVINLKMFVMIFLSKRHDTGMDYTTSGDRTEEVIFEVDLSGKSYETKDIDTHSKWAGAVIGREAGWSSRGYQTDSGTQAVAWPNEILAEAWPWDQAKFDLDLADLLGSSNQASVGRDWIVHVAVSYSNWSRAGIGNRAVAPLSIESNSGCLVIPCISISSTNLQNPV